MQIMGEPQKNEKSAAADASYPRPGYLIYQASRLFVRLNERRLAPRDVGAGQIPVLVALGRWGTQTQKELARIADVEQPTMASLLARMERDGLIRRSTDPADRRSSRVDLAPAGEAAFPEVVRSLEEVNALAYTGFSGEERRTFTAMLQRMIANLKTADVGDIADVLGVDGQRRGAVD